MHIISVLLQILCCVDIFLILFKLENDRSGQAVETGKVHKILNKK